MSESSPSLHPVGSPTELPSLQKRAKLWLTLLMISIVGIILPPLIGLSGTVFGMVSAFNELSTSGGGDPEALASDISTSLTTTAIGIGISILFGAVFLISLIFWLITLSKIKNAPETSRA